MDTELVKQVSESYTEAKSAWLAFFTQCKEDWKFKMSDQWADKDKAICNEKGLPMLSINHIFKNINLISGYQRQNRGEMKAYPIEGSDELCAEVLNMVIKWILIDRNVNFTVSDGFKDSLIGGISWLHPYMTFDDDPVCGDIVVKKISPFNILPDPHFTERDLSDCDYIIRHQRLSKPKLQRLYPKYVDQIKALSGSQIKSDGIVEDTVVPSDQGNYLNVVEYWHKDYEEITTVINTRNPEDTYVWNEKKGDLKEFLKLKINKDLKTITQKITKMRLATVIDGTLLVYDDYSPYGGSDFPFIPTFCFYESSYSDWVLKLHGLVRPLKDLQREKNKRRSQIMQAINTMPSSGWIVDHGAVDDKAELLQAAGAGRVIFKNPGKEISKIPPPDVPAALIQMETMFDNDIQVVGNNPDLLGQITERGVAGITIQLRQKQGLTSIQEVFDSLSDAQRTLGRRLIDMIVKNFSTQKIKRIIGDDFSFTQNIKELQAQLKELQQQVPVVPDIPIEFTPEEQVIHAAASDEAKNILEEQKMQERELAQEYAVQQQITEVKKQAIIIENQIKNVQAEEAEFWAKFEEIKKTARFDITIDETISSQTYRASILTMLTQMQQYGMAVPPEMILDYMELPKSSKDRYLKYMQDQQQQQLMLQQQQAMMKQSRAAPQ